RFWDLAASDAWRGGDPEYTAGVLLGRSSDGLWYVADVRRTRSSPLAIEQLVARAAERDAAWAAERGWPAPVIRMEQEPGSAGVAVIAQYRRRVLGAHDFRGVRATGSKQTRAAPVAARAEAGDISICRGIWNTEFLDELVAFPSGSHDDQVDALSGAYEQLAQTHAVPVACPVELPRSAPWLSVARW